MRSVLLALALVLAASLAVAADYAWPVVSVVDGDTIKAEIEGRIESVRLLGVDTPETGSLAKCDAERVKGERATGYLEAVLRSGQVGFDWNGKRDKYQRILARVTVNGEDVAELLIQAGLGRVYSGGKREEWCP